MRDAIVEAAIDELGAHPDATLADVAAAAGVARRTIYGHFASRSELVGAIAEKAAEDLRARMDALDALPGEPPTDLAVLTLWTWPVAKRYRLLLRLGRQELGEEEIVALMRPTRGRTLGVIADGHRDGSFHDFLPAETIAALADSATLVILEEHNRGTVADPAVALCMASLLVAGVGPVAAHRAIGRAKRYTDARLAAGS